MCLKHYKYTNIMGPLTCLSHACLIPKNVEKMYSLANYQITEYE